MRGRQTIPHSASSASSLAATSSQPVLTTRHRGRQRLSPRTSRRSIDSVPPLLWLLFLISGFLAGIYLGFQLSSASRSEIVDAQDLCNTHQQFWKVPGERHSSASARNQVSRDVLRDSRQDTRGMQISKSENNSAASNELEKDPSLSNLDYPRTNKTIAACLLIMDDSIRLAEWIAYHYTVLPLGSLVVAIDPHSSSQQRVIDILDLWKDRIDLKVYTNDSDWLDFKFDEGYKRRVYRPNGKIFKWFRNKEGYIFRSQSHKRRQHAFVRHCMKYHKRSVEGDGPRSENSIWVLMTDSDEYIMYNFLHTSEEDPTFYGEITKGVTIDDIDRERERVAEIRKKLPPLSRHVTIADWLGGQHNSVSCWRIPGLLMSSYESAQEFRDRDVPREINASHLMTLRFRKSARRIGNFSKVLLDVSWGKLSDYVWDAVQNIHNPHKRLCGMNGLTGSGADYIASVFRLYHFSAGTLETHVERIKDRRATGRNISFSRFQHRNVKPLYEDDDIRPWIPWFVEKVGMAEVQRLLVNPLRERYNEFESHPFVVAYRDMLTPGKGLTDEEYFARDDEYRADEDGEGEDADSDEDGSSKNEANNLEATEKKIHDLLRAPKVGIPDFPQSNSTISACLLVMDDSIRLAEWIAYHYTVLPLGSLTVAIDPSSKSTSRVLRILYAWRHRIDLKIYIKDDDWLNLKFDEGWRRRIYRNDGTLANWLAKKSGPVYRSQSHKRRQNYFALHCMRRYKKRIKDQSKPYWVLMTDTDEFLLYNYVHADEEDETNYELKRGTTMNKVNYDRMKAIPIRHRLPPMSLRVTVASWLEVENVRLSKQCWKFPGLHMSSYESPEAKRSHNIPDIVNATHLMTLRFRRAGLRYGNFSKTLLDVSWGKLDQYTYDDVQNIHNPQKRICGVNGFSGSNADYLSSVFRINHYSSGTLETHLERSKDRRYNHKNVSFDLFQKRNTEPEYEDDDIRPWIAWFIDKVGVADAKVLLLDPLQRAYKEFGQHPFVISNSRKMFID